MSVVQLGTVRAGEPERVQVVNSTRDCRQCFSYDKDNNKVYDPENNDCMDPISLNKLADSIDAVSIEDDVQNSDGKRVRQPDVATPPFWRSPYDQKCYEPSTLQTLFGNNDFAKDPTSRRIFRKPIIDIYLARRRLLYEFPSGIRFNVMTLNDMKDVNFRSKWGSPPIEIAEEHLPSNPLFDQREPLRHAYYVTETLYLANVPRQTDIAQGPFTQESDAYAAKKSEEKKMYSFVLKHMVERTVSDLIDYENDMIGTNGKIEYKLKDTTNNYDFVLWVGLENHEHPQPLLSETDTIEDIFQAHTAVNPIQYVFGSFLPKLQDKFTARRYFIKSIDNISWNERRQYEDEEQGYEDPTDTHRWTFTLFESNIEERKVSIVQVLKNAFKEDNQDNPYVKWMLKCLQLKRDGYNSFDEPEEGSERED